jgi:hypothetical protein
VLPSACAVYSADGRRVAVLAVRDEVVMLPMLPSGLYWVEWTYGDRLQRVPIAVVD